MALKKQTEESLIKKVGTVRTFSSNIYSTNWRKKRKQGESKVKLLENVLKPTDLKKTGKPWYLFLVLIEEKKNVTSNSENGEDGNSITKEKINIPKIEYGRN